MSIKVELPDHYLTATPRDVKNRKEFDRSGVYIFYDESDVPIYVGKTVSFKKRFSKHSTESEFFHLATTVRLYVVKSEYEKDIYETYLINDLKPEYNRAKTFYTRLEYEDMLHKVEERIFDVKREIEEIERTLCEISDPDSELIAELDSDPLGECLRLERQVAELKSRLKKLQIRKSNIKQRLSA